MLLGSIIVEVVNGAKGLNYLLLLSTKDELPQSFIDRILLRLSPSYPKGLREEAVVNGEIGRHV